MKCKYKKSGKALCSLYPKQSYFVALLAVGLKEITKAEMLVLHCSKYTQDLFNRTGIGHMGKSLALEIKDENVLSDVKKIIALRVE